MQKTRLTHAAASLAALLALAACNKPETIVAGDNDDPQAEALKNAPKIAPPPMIQASRTYRCKDNSLLYADFYTNNSVQIRTQKDGAPTALTAPDPAGPFTGAGYTISANAAQISFTAPGKGQLSCKA